MQVRTGEIHLEGGKIQQVVLSYGQKTFAAKLTFAWKGGMQDDWTYDIRKTSPRNPAAMFGQYYRREKQCRS